MIFLCTKEEALFWKKTCQRINFHPDYEEVSVIKSFCIEFAEGALFIELCNAPKPFIQGIVLDAFGHLCGIIDDESGELEGAYPLDEFGIRRTIFILAIDQKQFQNYFGPYASPASLYNLKDIVISSST